MTKTKSTMMAGADQHLDQSEEVRRQQRKAGFQPISTIDMTADEVAAQDRRINCADHGHVARSQKRSLPGPGRDGASRQRPPAL